MSEIGREVTKMSEIRTEMTIDDYINKRNEIQLEAESRGEETGRRCWAELGVANRHIEAVLRGDLTLTPGVRSEIERCLEEVRCLA